MPPSLAVVLINYDNESYTIPCLDSLEPQVSDDVEVIVVDNGSEPSSYEAVREAHEWPTYIRLESNEGFTGGNNVAIEHALDAGVEWVLLLNNDTVVEEGFLESFQTEAEDLPPYVGVVGPTVRTYDTGDVWVAGGSLIEPIAKPGHYRVPTEHSGAEGGRPVDYVNGCSMLVRREVFEDVGYLDEDFFIFFGETEFCVRARRAGWSCRQVAVEGVRHKDSIGYDVNSFRDYYTARNRVHFARKVNPAWMFPVFLLWFLARWGVVQPVYHLLTGNASVVPATLRGVVDGLRGRTGAGH